VRRSSRAAIGLGAAAVLAVVVLVVASLHESLVRPGAEGSDRTFPSTAPTTSPPTTSAPTTASPPATAQVTATGETQPVPHAGDAADDVAIWVHPTDPSSSTIIGTDKRGALLVYDLSGAQIQSLAVGRANNVDLRGDVVAFTNRSDDTIGIHRVDPATRQLRDVAARSITTGMPVYGACMYRSAVTGTEYVFVTSTAGQVQQWALSTTDGGLVDAAQVRSFAVGSVSEGCVADDETGQLYIGEESVGIWRYGAEPDAGTARVQVAAVSAGGPLESDVEGLALARGAGGADYLIASSQGRNSFVVYRREPGHAFVAEFTVAAGGGADPVTGTDGIEVTTTGLGGDYPSGLFIAQNGANDGGNQNFELVPFERIAALLR
jgi:3-phytase